MSHAIDVDLKGEHHFLDLLYMTFLGVALGVDAGQLIPHVCQLLILCLVSDQRGGKSKSN
jgi:hypothetical protein